jgi:hypothetical protein
MKQNLPIIQVTPAAAVRLSRKKRLKVTTLEARQWLLRHRKAIERRLADAAQGAINDALEEIMFTEWPEPAFNKMYHQIEDALNEAIEKHEESHRLQLLSICWHPAEMHDRVRCFLRHKETKPKIAYWLVDLSFEEVDGDPTADHPEIPYLVKLIYEQGQVSATFEQRMIHTKVPRGKGQVEPEQEK